MIEIHGLSKSYGEQLLFTDVAFNVRKGERVGLVGRNGHGKSTLFRIVIGEEAYDKGNIAIPKNYKIGYLQQITEFTRKTVIEETCKGLPKEHKDDIWKAEKILTGLGFKKKEIEGSPSVLSGGYQMRIELAKVLVSEPDMLLLDEPTNFLDIISIRWFEKFLRRWKGELIIISHDRNFMDNVCTCVVGIHRTQVKKVAGHTGKYYSAITKEEETYEKRRVNEEKQRKQIEEYITSFRAKARRAKSVQSSIKRLDRMEKFDKLGEISTLSFSFNPAPFRPPVAIEVKNINFSYNEEKPYLINNCTFTVERGDKVCIAGANGKGKTTLAKILAGVMKPLSGEIKINPQAKKAYYEQGNTAKLNDNMTIEDEVVGAHPGKNKTDVRNICGAMMFPGDNVLKKIAVLSGGERSRVLLAKALLSPSNLLILDEPTHHLDMESCSALFEAVQEYPGAAVVVTHDEYFLHKVATKLIMFLSDRIVVFPGNYLEFLDQIGWDDVRVDKPALSGGVLKKIKKQKNINKKEERKTRADERKAYREKIRPFKMKIEKIEKEIASFEKKKAVLTEDIIKSSEGKDSSAIVELSKRLNGVKSQIEDLYEKLSTSFQDYERAKEKHRGNEETYPQKNTGRELFDQHACPRE